MKVFNKTIISKTLFAGLCLGLMANTYANDSIGYVATGGVEYIKNNKIAMQSEDLKIGKGLIQVDYQFKNLSHQNITENILFPLPSVPVPQYYDFADTKEMIDSFKILVDNKPINYKTHVRAFMYPLDKNGALKFDAQKIDVTEDFKKCGVTEKEMQYPWTNQGILKNIHKKLLTCNNSKLKNLIDDADNINMNSDDELEDAVYWESQIIYSWQQLFKANSITNIKHSYKPLVGGSAALVEGQYGDFCVDNATKRALAEAEMKPYFSLGYILTTGSNWAGSIDNFKLTVEKDKDELVSFCWAGKGKINKINDNTFQIIEKNFKPTQDLDIAFIRPE